MAKNVRNTEGDLGGGEEQAKRPSAQSEKTRQEAHADAKKGEEQSAEPSTDDAVEEAEEDAVEEAEEVVELDLTRPRRARRGGGESSRGRRAGEGGGADEGGPEDLIGGEASSLTLLQTREHQKATQTAARNVAYALLGILALAIVFQYISTWVVVVAWGPRGYTSTTGKNDTPTTGTGDTAKTGTDDAAHERQIDDAAHERQIAAFKEASIVVDRLFNSLLPVISGLVGSAVTYYFARETNRR